MESLLIREEGKERSFFIESRVVTLGRSGKNDIVLKDRNASRQHCNIIQVGDGWFVVDCESHNGTFINEERVKKKELQEGDTISIGAVDIIFSLKRKRDDTPSMDEPKALEKSENPEIENSDIIEEIDLCGEAPVQGQEQEIEELQEEIEKKTKKVAKMKERNMCPTKQVRPEKVTKSLRENFDFNGTKEDNVRRDLEKLKEVYQKLASRMCWREIGQEKFAESFLVALLTGGHCLIKGETTVVSILLPKLAKNLGLTWQYCFGDEQKQPEATNLLFMQNFCPQNLLANLWQTSAAERDHQKYPRMMIMAENAENNLDTLLQNAYIFSIAIPLLEMEQEVAFLRMYMDISRPEKPVSSAHELFSFRMLLDEVIISSQILDYIARIVRSTRPQNPQALSLTREKIARGVEPALGAWIVKAARARAALQGEYAVSAKDVQVVAQALIPARIKIVPAVIKTGETNQSVYNDIIGLTKEPSE